MHLPTALEEKSEVMYDFILGNLIFLDKITIMLTDNSLFKSNN